MPLTRRANLKRSKPLARSTKPLRKVGAAKAGKVKRYKAFMSSAAWKALRKRVIRRADGKCEAMVGQAYVGIGGPWRCNNPGVVVDHKTYRRFGGNELLEDLQLLCKDCNARETVAKRANWMGR